MKRVEQVEQKYAGISADRKQTKTELCIIKNLTMIGFTVVQELVCEQLILVPRLSRMPDFQDFGFDLRLPWLINPVSNSGTDSQSWLGGCRIMSIVAKSHGNLR
jgi:hypothetical protein